MRLLASLNSVFALLVATALANTEKLIFVAPAPVALPDAAPGLDALSLATIDPIETSLRTALARAFPTEDHPHGLDSWYLLGGLSYGQRYEVRICWPAVEPTEFWLDVFNITHVFDNPSLIQSLAAFSEERQTLSPNAAEERRASSKPTATTLFLRIQAAADYFSTNKTLMTDPPLVTVDIILDPYLGSIFPASLVPTAIYIVALAIISWFVSRWIWEYLAVPTHNKSHTD